MNENLNYKQAYYYLFNKVTDIIKALKNIQIHSENICINDEICSDNQINEAQVLQNMAMHIKEQL